MADEQQEKEERMKVNVFKIPQSSPDDISGLKDLIENQKILDPRYIAAIMGKTEGNGCVNDFTRGFAVATLKAYLRPLVGINTTEQIVFVMSGGTEGVLSPHMTVFTREPSVSSSASSSSGTTVSSVGLALGVLHTRDFRVEEIGTITMVQVVAKGVKEAMAKAGLADKDVHFVQIKCPLITAAARSSGSQGSSSITQDSYKSMAYSRAASALGVAMALGEIDAEQLTESDICSNHGLYSSVASASAGVELKNCEILVLGNSKHSDSDFVIGHSVMEHALDTAAVERAVASLPPPLNEGTHMNSRIVNVFCKAEADASGEVLGCRHTMMDDSDINHTRMARAVVGAVVASVVKDPMIYVSGGSEHQGPLGGGPIAVVSRR
jgi:cyanuric acid amidohydrolase